MDKTNIHVSETLAMNCEKDLQISKIERHMDKYEQVLERGRQELFKDGYESFIGEEQGICVYMLWELQRLHL